MRQVILAGAVMLGLAAAPAIAADDAFVTNTAKAGMAEVELGKLAVEKASSPDVKQFGQKMVDEHGKAGDELKTLAGNKHITLPVELDAKDKDMRDKLMKLSGPSFDHAYMQAMVSGHLKALADFRTESRSGQDADVKAWAAKTLPTIEEHLKMARAASGAVGTSGKK